MRRLAAILAALALTAGALLLRSTAPADAATPDPEVTSWVASQRGWYGRRTIDPTNPQLTAMAQEQADRMARCGCVYHHPALGWLLSQGWGSVAENVARAPSRWQAHVALSYSPPHLANQLGPWDAMGVATASGPDGSVYVAEVFGALP